MGILNKIHEERKIFLFIGDIVAFSPFESGELVGIYLYDDFSKKIKSIQKNIQIKEVADSIDSLDKIEIKEREDPFNTSLIRCVVWKTVDGNYHWNGFTTDVLIQKIGEF